MFDLMLNFAAHFTDLCLASFVGANVDSQVHCPTEHFAAFKRTFKGLSPIVMVHMVHKPISPSKAALTFFKLQE